MADKSKERLELEARATALGLKFPANIGDVKLAKRIKEHDGNTLFEGDALKGTEVVPTISGTRVVGGGLLEADVPDDQANTNAPGDSASITGAAKTVAIPEVPKTGEGKGAPKSSSVSGSPTPQTGAQVSIVGPKRGRWRAGLHFTAEPRILLVDELTDDEIAAIELDDKLTVTPVE